MPALHNPRWEKFCQIIVFGDVTSQKQAYIEAGYKARNHSAEVCGNRLLRFVEPIVQRVRELQDQQRQALEQKNRFTRDTIANRMALASRIAEEDRNPNALYGAEQAIAKLYGLITDKFEDATKVDWNSTTSMRDIGAKLLQSVGFASPDDASIQAAIEANDVFIAELEQIRDRAQGRTIDQDG
jgi:hypothetical protein